LGAGEACDNGPDNFNCYPAPNTGDLCGACDNQNTFCKDGLTCVPTDAQGTGKCARFCCTDADCGGATGSCAKGFSNDPMVGLCGTPGM
jgi:hypothetical protein